MVERQQAENAELGHSHAALHQRMAEKCEASLAEFVAKAEQQLSAVVERHSAEHASFLQQTEGAMPRPKWSSGLLNTRRIEEHLMKQHEFRKAAKFKALADTSEAEEAQDKQEEYWLKKTIEEGNLLQRQARELHAQSLRAALQRDELLLAQRREMEKLSKRFLVERTELAKAHAVQRAELDTALVGCYNPRKLGLGPSPLVPASPLCLSLMTPSLKLTSRRSEPILAGRRSQSVPPSPVLYNNRAGTSDVSEESSPRIPQALTPKPHGLIISGPPSPMRGPITSQRSLGLV